MKHNSVALAFVAVLLLGVSASASDSIPPTPESIGRVTQLAFSEEHQWPSRILATMREISSKTDSIVERQLGTEIAYLEEYCGKVRDDQELLLLRLRVPGSSPKRTKDILIAWTRLIRSLDGVYSRAAVITARLRVHFRAPADAKPYDELKTFYAEAARLALDQQRTMENFILALPE